VDGVVQEGDRAAEDTAKDFGNDQAESRDHGPAENRGAQRRVVVTVVTVRVGVVHMAVVMAVLGVVNTCVVVRMVVHQVRRVHFTRLAWIVLLLGSLGCKRSTARFGCATQKTHRQECLCYQWEV